MTGRRGVSRACWIRPFAVTVRSAVVSRRRNRAVVSSWLRLQLTTWRRSRASHVFGSARGASFSFSASFGVHRAIADARTATDAERAGPASRRLAGAVVGVQDVTRPFGSSPSVECPLAGLMASSASVVRPTRVPVTAWIRRLVLCALAPFQVGGQTLARGPSEGSGGVLGSS